MNLISKNTTAATLVRHKTSRKITGTGAER